MFSDAHCHLYDLAQKQHLTQPQDQAQTLSQLNLSYCCASAQSHTEFTWHEKLAQHSTTPKIVTTFGIHPQQLIKDNLIFLEKLAQEKRIVAIGEIGFDFFTAQDRGSEATQKELWAIQLELAHHYNLPIVIHCRKALALIFSDSKKLKNLPAVIFHGWGGSVIEAKTFLKRGVSAFFSIGKDILRGKKNTCQSVAQLDARFLLTESDAPYMTLKTQSFTEAQDISTVTSQCALLRGISPSDNNAFRQFLAQINSNFQQAFLC